MVDQRPYHDHTRFAIDAQQALGLWQRDAESWHFGVLSLDPASQISKRWGLSVGFRYGLVFMNVPRDSAYIVRGKKGSTCGSIVSRVDTCNIAHLRSALKPSPKPPVHGGVSI